MQTYETLFITSPDLLEEDERSTVEALAKVVTDGGGVMHSNDRMGRRRLGYPIQKCDDGVYTRFLYESAVAVPKELERRFRLSDKVLRGLTVRLEEEWAEDAKKQAVIDAERRAEAAAQAEIDAAAAAEAAAAEAAKAAEAPEETPAPVAEAPQPAGAEAAEAKPAEAEPAKAKPADDA